MGWGLTLVNWFTGLLWVGLAAYCIFWLRELPWWLIGLLVVVSLAGMGTQLVALRRVRKAGAEDPATAEPS